MNKKNLNFRKGFTLVELLVVILVIFIVGGIIMSILYSAFRGATKTNTIDIVRRNGDYAVSQMSRMIRYSQSFGGVSTDGTNYVTNCSLLTYSPSTISPKIIAPKKEKGGFSIIADFIQRFIMSGKKEASMLLSKIASLTLRSEKTLVKRVAASTTVYLGYQTAGGNATGNCNRIRAQQLSPITTAQAGTVSQGYAYLSGNTTGYSGTVYMVVYLDDGSNFPGNLIAASNGILIPTTQAAGWVSFNFSPSFNTTAGQVLWLGVYGYVGGAGACGTAGPLISLDVGILGNYANLLYRYADYTAGSTPPSVFPISNPGTTTVSFSEYLVVNITPTPTPTPLPTSTPTPTPTPPLPKYNYVKITSFDGGVTTFSCLDSIAHPPNGQIASTSASASIPLVDTNSSVTVNSCWFTCLQNSLSSPVTIGINATLSAQTTSSFFERQATIPFQTSVTMRNY